MPRLSIMLTSKTVPPSLSLSCSKIHTVRTIFASAMSRAKMASRIIVALRQRLLQKQYTHHTYTQVSSIRWTDRHWLSRQTVRHKHISNMHRASSKKNERENKIERIVYSDFHVADRTRARFVETTWEFVLCSRVVSQQSRKKKKKMRKKIRKIENTGSEKHETNLYVCARHYRHSTIKKDGWSYVCVRVCTMYIEHTERNMKCNRMNCT